MNVTPKTAMLTAILAVALSVSLGCNRQRVPQTGTDTTSSGTSSGTSGTSGTSDTSSGSSTSGASGSGPASRAGAAVDDTVVTGKVKAALLADSDLKSLNISVETRNGAVDLSGSALNQAQIDRAVKVASAVPGVKMVQNRLVIHG